MTSQARAGCRGYITVAIVCASTVAGIAGCGGSSHSPLTPVTVTGNWEFSAAAASSGTTSLPVYLLSNGADVWGTVVLPPEPQICVAGCCGGPLSGMDPSLTGTIDGNGNLKLGSASSSNSPVFTMSGMVSGATLSNGSFALTGACGTQGAITGTEYPAINGIYSGTVASQNLGQNFTVTMVLNQSNSPNSSGFLGLTGTLSVSGYSCLTSTALQVNTSFVGNTFGGELNITSKEGFGYAGTLSADGKTIALTYGLFGTSGSCNDDNGKGTLTLQ